MSSAGDEEPGTGLATGVSEQFQRGDWVTRRPVVAAGAPHDIRQFLLSEDWTWKNGALAIATVKRQLELYDRARSRIEQAVPPRTLFDETLQKIGKLITENPDNIDAIKELNDPLLAHALWKSPHISYLFFRSAQNQQSKIDAETKPPPRGGTDKEAIDLWILQNEAWLRTNMTKTEPWFEGLVPLSASKDVWDDSTTTEIARKIPRHDLDGFKFLDAKRAPAVYIQPSVNLFKEKFEEITNGQLKGLDWDNVFVAGGICVGTLLSTGDPDAPNQASEWKSSDIDIYIWGLGPIEANEKIKHIFSIFKANLPPDTPTLVIRNSKTVTLLAPYPNRRFQIILKKVKTPKEVLLNFDLDICAIGFDGSEVWMLPRMARALETGYNTFTMDMIQGHYLGDRRATQEQRVFKYANKGYGIRILPKYLQALETIDMNSLAKEARYHDGAQLWKRENLSLETRAKKSRLYTDRFIDATLKWTSNAAIPPHHIGSGFTGSENRPNEPGLPTFTHALLDTRGQITNEPLRRSCLTGFSLLYRHVALWEAKQEGRIAIQEDVWASTTYDETDYGITYEDLPQYAWDETFQIGEYERQIKRFNESISSSIKTSKLSLPAAQRMATGQTVDQVFTAGNTLVIPIWLPNDFLEFAQEILATALQEAGLPSTDILVPVENGPDLTQTLFLISPTNMWQQVDRRVDEIHELLWSFMHSNPSAEKEKSERTQTLMRQISHRSIRQALGDEGEYKAFASWVIREPGSIAGFHYGGFGQGFWDDIGTQDYEGNPGPLDFEYGT